MEFSEELYSSRNFSSLHQFRLDGFFCDVTLRCAEKSILAHKAVLASQSRYFYNALTSAGSDTAEFEMPMGIASHNVEALVDFMYTGTLVVESNNLRELLRLHDLLDIVGLDTALCKSLRKLITPGNLHHFVTFYQHISKIDILRESFEHIFLHEFENIADQLLTTGSELLEVITLLGRPELNITREETVRDFVVTWLAVNKTKIRGDDPGDILDLIWWQDLSLQTLNSVYFSTDETCANFQKPRALHAMKSRSSGLEDVHYQRAGQYSRSLFAISSYDG